MVKNLSKYLNIWRYLDPEGCFVSADLDFSRIYKIKEPGTLSFWSEVEIDIGNSPIVNFNASISDNAVVTFIFQNQSNKDDQIKHYLSNYQKTELIQELKESKQIQLSQSKNRKVEIYVILTIASVKKKNLLMLPNEIQVINDLWQNISPKKKSIQNQIKEATQQLNQLENQFLHFLKAYNPVRLSKDCSYKYCMKIINGEEAGFNQVKDYDHLKDEAELAYHYSLREQLVTSSYEYEKDHLLIKNGSKNKFIKTIGIERFPSEIGPFSLMNTFEEMNCDFRYLFCYTKTNSQNAKKKLKQRRSLEIGKQTSSNQFEVEDEIGVLEENIKEMVGTRGSAFIAGGLFIVESSDYSSLKQSIDHTLMALNELGSEGWSFVDDHYILESHLAFLPGHWKQVQRKGLMLTTHLTYLIPLYKNWSGFGSGECLYKNTSGELVQFALYNKELKASMGVVTAPTGSGKSFAINDFIKNILSCTDGIVFTLEPGNSYEKINQIFEGEYIVFDSSARFSLSPFYYNEDFFDSINTYDVDALESISMAVQAMISPDENMDTLQKRIIEEGILQAYKISKEELIPNISDLVSVFDEWNGPEEEVKIARLFSLKLKYYTDRKYGKLFNQRQAVRVSNRFVSFDISGIKDPIIQKVALFCIKNITYNAMKVPGITKYFFLDEVWKLLDDSNKVAEDLIKTIFKMFRKLQGVGYAITQSFDEIGESKAGRTILQNAEVIINFAMKGSDEEKAMKQYGYNELEISAIKQISSSIGYGFFRFGKYRSVLKMSPSPLEYWIYTTDATDINVINICKEQYNLNYLKDAVVMCSRLYPSGARSLKGLSTKELVSSIKKQGATQDV